MAIGKNPDIAVWVVTPNGRALARQLRQQWPTATLFCSQRLGPPEKPGQCFERLGPAVERNFRQYRGHIFIMATGIVVRTIAPLLQHKGIDPGVVVVDDRGRFAISLAAGHLGGANKLARQAADCLGATPVITTATDINDKPAIDLLAVERHLKIENPSGIKAVNMALLSDQAVRLHDPNGLLSGCLPHTVDFPKEKEVQGENGDIESAPAGVWIADTLQPVPHRTLVLRPPSLVAGIGCNRHTPSEEIRALLLQVLDRFALAPKSLISIGSIDLKADEKGLIDLAAELELSLQFFTKKELARVDGVRTPSAMVAKHVGVPSVCEAAAILASRNGRLIVPKQNTRNVTVAIARTASMSSASDPVIRPTCPNAPGKC